MNFKKNILYSKKFILFLFMILSYAVSYAEPVSSSNILKKETEKTYLVKINSHNLSEYYIAAEKNNTIIHYYEDKHESSFVSPKIKDFFIEKECEEYFNLIFKNPVHSFYIIATDITRSMRD